MTKILITGVAGFIGFHLARRLRVEADVEIVGIDNLNEYYDVRLKMARLELLRDLRFEKMDLTDKDGLQRLFEEFKPDIVVNLAAQAGVRHSLENPELYVSSNIVGFFNVLECCRKASVGRLIYASSSSIYGNQTTVPFSEDSMTDTPVSLYAATKKSNELLAYSYSHLYKICVTGLRFFTVYGPYGRPDMAPYIFTEAIMNGKEVNVFNNGDLMRDFTYIDDIVEGIVRVVKQPSASPVAVYNIGCGKPVRLMDFLAAIEDAVGRKAEIRFQPMQKGDVYQTYADISAMERDYGFRPQTEMQEGVKRYVEWFREFYG